MSEAAANLEQLILVQLASVFPDQHKEGGGPGGGGGDDHTSMSSSSSRSTMVCCELFSMPDVTFSHSDHTLHVKPSFFELLSLESFFH